MKGFNTDHCNNYTNHCRISCKGWVTSTGGALWRMFRASLPRPHTSPSHRSSQSCPLSLIFSVFSEAFASVFISTVIVVRNNYIYIILYIFPFSFPPDFFIRTIQSHFHISAQNQKYVFLQINCSLEYMFI